MFKLSAHSNSAKVCYRCPAEGNCKSHTNEEDNLGKGVGLSASAVVQVPFIGGTGNHEEEQEADGSIFKAVQARWPVRYP